MHASLTPQQLAAWMKSEHRPRLLDVRQPEEHELAALPGSTLIPLGEILHRAGEIESWKEQDIVVYCHHGVRSLSGAAILHRAGFENAASLTGGIDAWSLLIDAGVPRY